MNEAIQAALQSVLTLDGVLLLLAGTLCGIVVAVIPGIGAPVALAILLPITFAMTPEQALLFLLPVIGAGGFAGSQTAILLGIPGDATNAATTLDGYAMSRQGRAGEAIGASATASIIGALVGVTVLMLSIPLVRTMVLSIGPEEIFLFALAGVLLVGTLSTSGTGGLVKGIASGLFGMACGLIGYNFAQGGTRFTLGYAELADGVPLVPVLVGLFAIPEVFDLMKRKGAISSEAPRYGGVRTGINAAIKRPFTVLRGSLMGTAIGMVPGVGASIACWVAYGAAKSGDERRRARSSTSSKKSPSSEPRFGEGNVEGVIAPESAVNATDGGALMPLLALGIPGGISTAILAGAFLLHGIQPGPTMFSSQLHLVYVMIFAVVASNVLAAIVGLGTGRYLMRITATPFYIIVPCVISLGVIGSVASTGSMLGLYTFLFFGYIGLLIHNNGYSRAAVVVGLILAPVIENNLLTALQTNRGEWSWLINKPGTATIIALVALTLLAKIVGTRRQRQVVQGYTT